MSVYETEKRAKAQGFFFAMVPVLPRYEQFGYVMYSTEQEAHEAGRDAVKRGECSAYTVAKNTI